MATCMYLAKGSSKEFLQATRGKEPTDHLASQVLDKASDSIASKEINAAVVHSNTTNIGTDQATTGGRPLTAVREISDHKMNNVSGAHHLVHHSQPKTVPSEPNQCTADATGSSQEKF
ncbi:hypothetical protein H6P81_013190 [Aristolochia fimbriata]|uniref:Uncharacterized protein n=1 Tax=Aristolochia fimbriata TaxID=158543 RepID=A0AAV7EH88_ARIFI|nr:hypothetical protein H6P81_013190 [Aristolochia fimbriata]